MHNAINWFEIPTRDLDKAVRFYEATFATTLQRETFGGMPHAMFPVEKAETSVTGAIVAAPHLSPGASGTLIYLQADDGVRATLARARAAGAAELQPHTAIGPHGFIAVVRDPDGNSIGLHSMKE